MCCEIGVRHRGEAVRVWRGGVRPQSEYRPMEKTRVSKRIWARLTVLVVGAALVWSPTAGAWGNRAMRTISAMALQVLRHDFPHTFRPGGVVGQNFEPDVMLGSMEGWQVIAERTPLNSDAEVIQSIANEIELLREARKHGPTSYFAYRMGVLASLTAHAMLPFGFPWTSEEQELRRLIVADIERHIDTYGFSVTQKNRRFIRNTPEYFEDRRAFHTDDRRLIAHDYRTGVGYDGMMRQAGKAYFVNAVETVADVWYTVLSPDAPAVGIGLTRPSPRTLTFYFLDEMAFLLNVKNNMHQVEKVYANFERVNPRMPEAYERLGDIFYANDNREARLRGVAEWKKAFNLGGPDRARIGRKLSAHYLDEGRHYFSRAGQPGSEETDLNTALNAFELAMDFDRASDTAAESIQQTHVAISERNERLEMTLNIIATGERVHEEANRFREARDFANAIGTYRQAIGFFEAVDDEFSEHANTAGEKIRRLGREISDVISDVLDEASQAIDEGDRSRDRNLFEEAMGHYQRVSGILAVIPADEHPTVQQDKQEVISLAERKMEETNVARLRYEQAQQEQAQQQAAQAPGAPR